MAHIKLLAFNISFIQYLNINIVFNLSRWSIVDYYQIPSSYFYGSLSKLLRASFYNGAASIGNRFEFASLIFNTTSALSIKLQRLTVLFHNTKISIISNIISCKLLYYTNSKNYVRSGEFIDSCNMDICCDLLSVARPVWINLTTQK